MSISISNDTQFLIKGVTNAEDFKTLTQRNTARWPAYLLGAKVARVKVVYNDEPMLMLSGKILGSIRDNIDDEGEKQLTRDYGIQSIVKKGKKRYDLLFTTPEQREQALALKRLQAGGLAIEVEEWKRMVRLEPCFNCWGLDGHPQSACTKPTMCRYCGRQNVHDSRTCEYKLLTSWHFCGLCQRKGHYACDRENCDAYINVYRKLCASLQVQMPNKVLENSTLNMAYVDGMSSTLTLMKQITGNPVNFMEITSKFVSGPVLGAYLAKRDAQAKAVENERARESLRKEQEAAEAASRTASTQPHATIQNQQRDTLVSQNMLNFRNQLNVSEAVWNYGGMTQQQFATLQPAQQEEIRRQLSQQTTQALTQRHQTQQSQQRQSQQAGQNGIQWKQWYQWQQWKP